MAICPALGYFTKQNLLCWLILMFVVLVLHDFRNFKHLALFIFTSGISSVIVFGICYWRWGDAFIFWTFEILGGARKKISFSPSAFHLSIPRCIDHLIRAWMEIAIGFVGGILLLRGRGIKKFGPIFVAWILLICLEALISSVNWGPLYHFGPGVVIGVIFLLSALPQIWPYTRMTRDNDVSLLIYNWGKPLIAVAGVMTIFIALHVVPTGDKHEARYWKQQSLSDVYRYIRDIENEFDGLPADQVLLDIGNWIYLRHSVLIKDRAISLADQPPGGIYENMYVMVDRIRRKTYKKILVRDLHSPFFPYDWFSWEKPSGVRDALLKYYNEVRTIPAVEENASPMIRNMQAGPVSVLVPKSNP